MDDLLYKYFVTFLCAVLLLLILALIRYGIKAYFEVQMKKANATSGVAMTGMAVLLTAFISMTGLGNTLLGVLINGLKRLLPELTLEPPSETASLLLFVVFAAAVAGICYMYYSQYRIEIEKIQHQEQDRIRKLKINDPPLVPQESPVFHERLKALFQLKFKKFQLELDVTKNDTRNKVFYGFYNDEFRFYYKLINCWDDENKIISIAEQQMIYDDLVEKGKQLSAANPNAQIDYYCVTNGNYEKINTHAPPQYFLQIKTENEFLNELIDFTPYLKKICKRFNEDKLPFSNRSHDEEKFTLAQTFIPPKFNSGQTDLAGYLDTWLGEDSARHIALLGDYGTGKTSFTKFYAYHLADSILKGQSVKRFPIFISLTNTSPMHGGIEQYIKAFLGENDLETNYETLQKLIHCGKVVFLLDGFDEMGFIGTHENRFEQLNAIWQLATKGNKILVSGRPSYFPTQFEEKNYLKIKTPEEQVVPQAIPFCERVEIDFLDDEAIEDSIKKYYFNPDSFLNFIFSNRSIYELCKRPSMMHIVREMLPLLTLDKNSGQLQSGELMRQYIHHWIDRQYSKNIVTAFKNDMEKKEFIFNFFKDLAGDYYDYGRGTISLKASDIKQRLQLSMAQLKIIGEEQTQGFESEILTGYFLERINDTYKFVHKSFLEYFVAQRIIELLDKKDFKNPLIQSKSWTFEIQKFVYDTFSQEAIEKSEGSGVPLIMHLAYGSFWSAVLCTLFYGSVNILHKVSKVFNKIHIKTSCFYVFNEINNLQKQKPILLKLLIFCFLSIILFFIYRTNLTPSKISTIWLIGIQTIVSLLVLVLSVILTTFSLARKSISRISYYSYNLSTFLISVTLIFIALIVIILCLIRPHKNQLEMLYQNQIGNFVYYIYIISSVFTTLTTFLSIFMTTLYVIVNEMKFVANSYAISMNLNIINAERYSTLYLFSSFNNFHGNKLSEKKLYSSYFPILFRDTEVIKSSLSSCIIGFNNSFCYKLTLIGKCVEISIFNTYLIDVNFEGLSLYSRDKFRFILHSMTPEMIDPVTFLSFKNFINREQLEIGKHIILINSRGIKELLNTPSVSEQKA